MTTRKEDPRDICGFCGYYRGAHYAVNYANGPHVSGVVLICPSKTFHSIHEARELIDDARKRTLK